MQKQKEFLGYALGGLLFVLIIPTLMWLASRMPNPLDAPLARLIVAIVLGFINACIRPLVKLLALPINFMTLGLFTFVINGLMVMLCSWVVRPHFEVANFWWALGFSIVLTLVNWALHLFMPSKKKR